MSSNLIASFARLGAICVCAAFSPATLAASILYGDVNDFGDDGVLEYQEVTESSTTDGVPLFGPPEVEVNRLDFDPVFGSTSTSGGVDFTDGQLNFMIEALPGTGVTSFTISESGSYSFTGLGTAATTVNFGVLATVTILEVDGVSIAPIEVTASTSDTLNLVDDPGFAAPWNLGLLVELGSVLAPGFDAGVTLAEVVINNTLATSSEVGTGAFIDKKDFFLQPSGNLDPDDVIPEPTALALAALAAAGLAARRS